MAHLRSLPHLAPFQTALTPHLQDTHDLFSTLVASLQLSTNTRFFRSYPNSFTTKDAAANLSSLRFSQSNRSTDPNDPSRIVTTATTTFSMNRDIAKGICQHFIDARLIENAAEPLNPTFKERGIYQITPKLPASRLLGKQSRSGFQSRELCATKVKALLGQSEGLAPECNPTWYGFSQLLLFLCGSLGVLQCT
ncbi:hypothetical protein PtA15_7A230 [Puccinia triticina]|uniref:DEP domain-containing protein n=1 Tax=Puccinia triticina TaxID=208348 RepID=A0ABY7CMP8_9BASI|nr:uncharacterized protein PtA15_7A230 [Puccinia triticina]WAQ86504.1 hypothetical protein PtA15_7A230 [Puccinia triticina]